MLSGETKGRYGSLFDRRLLALTICWYPRTSPHAGRNMALWRVAKGLRRHLFRQDFTRLYRCSDRGLCQELTSFLYFAPYD